MADDVNTDPAAKTEVSPGAEANSVPAGAAKNCPYCLVCITSADEAEICPGCSAVYHRECWQENGGCGVYGCAHVPQVESRRAIEVPHSYWGQENKPCPSCGQQILAAAIRCRHCGMTFSSARPQGANEFQSRAALEARLPTARKRVIQIFLLSVIPFTAPVAAMWGLLWRRSHEEELETLPPLHVGLSKIGLAASLVLTLALAVMTALYVLVRGG